MGRPPGGLSAGGQKGWGAAAHYMKAVAKHRGWQNGSHRDFFTIKDRLADETGNPAHIKLLFLALRGLHQNFYEPLATYGEVQAGIAAANEFVETLERADIWDKR